MKLLLDPGEQGQGWGSGWEREHSGLPQAYVSVSLSGSSPLFSQTRNLHRTELGSPRDCRGQGWTLTEGSLRGIETQLLFHLMTKWFG